MRYLSTAEATKPRGFDTTDFYTCAECWGRVRPHGMTPEEAPETLCFGSSTKQLCAACYKRWLKSHPDEVNRRVPGRVYRKGQTHRRVPEPRGPLSPDEVRVSRMLEARVPGADREQVAAILGLIGEV